ncbi:MAG: hypothetical protein ITG00_12065 [Flavobacterium sp.]|nr:hypothetical protein [Flavobacterium sp.]
MFKHFIRLEWKAFIRSASFGANLAIKILMGLAALYFAVMFILLGSLLYLGLEKAEMDPLPTVSRFMIYYFIGDLVIRYFLQQMPVMNIRPLLSLPIKRSTIVHFTLGKTIISFFNIVHLFFVIPFTIVMLYKGLPVAQVLLWHIAFVSLIFCNNFINVLVNNNDRIFYPIAGVIIAAALAQYYGWYDITVYTGPFFLSFYETYYAFLIPVIALAALYYFSFSYFEKNLHLDTGLAKKSDIAKTEDFNWLNRFGTLGTFLKNDIRLLKRNKRSRGTVIMSIVFIFYGMLFFTGAIEQYSSPAWQIFAAIFVSGGFLFTFGQFVPSWDSSYYQLMMSQNISYKEYLSSKWWLMVIATFVSTIIASFYLYFGWEIYMLIVVGAIYNIGVNSHLVLLGGAFVKTPIDLTTHKAVFGDKQSFNFKTILLSLPKLLLPMLLYAAGYYTHSAEAGFLLVTIAGVIGFALRDRVFNMIERIYKTEKYKTIAAYKQKN